MDFTRVWQEIVWYATSRARDALAELSARLRDERVELGPQLQWADKWKQCMLIELVSVWKSESW